MPEYFDHADSGAGRFAVTNTWVDCAAVGNFDGNTAGREQIVYVVALKHRSSSGNHFRLGMIGGSEFDDEKVNNEIKTFGPMTKTFATNVEEGEYAAAGGSNANENTQIVPLACDIGENDGVLARYRDVQFMYSDPSVEGILQAAPYFKGLQDKGNTSISFGRSYTTTDQQTAGWNASAGVTSSWQISSLFALTAQACWQGSGSTLIEDSMSQKWGSTFTAKDDNSVIVQRTAAYIYNYEVANANGEFEDNTLLAIKVPKGPTYFQLSVDEYNSFADRYNSIMEASEAESPALLTKLDAADNYMKDNLGNPEAYRGDFNGVGCIKLSDADYETSHTGSTTSNWTKDESHREGTSSSHGFRVDFALYIGKPTSFRAGPFGGYGRQWGSGNYTTTASSDGTSGTVDKINLSSIAGTVLPEEAVSDYGFKWSFGQWNSN
ncbi:MAG: hypothetical protein HUJ79_07490, partial [Firmicutes bacterium]|nr:hypothetical protein [Bacillota bacterium]